MKGTLSFSLFATLALGLGACQKQQTEAERKAEIERQARQRLHTGRRSDDRKKMSQLHAELVARMNALAAAQKSPIATATPGAHESVSSSPH